MRVYVAGPYTLGDRSENLRNIMKATIEILDAGHEPFCPLLSFFLDLTYPRPWEDWMRLDLAWLKVAEAVVRIYGESSGGDVETRLGTDLGIPVFYSTGPELNVEALKRFLESVA